MRGGLTMALSHQQLAALARIQGRATLYEAEIVRPDGERRLLAYCGRRSSAGLGTAFDQRSTFVFVFLKLPRSTPVTKPKGKVELHFKGGAVIRFTGRTKRDVIMEDTPLRYVADAEPVAASG